MLRRSKLTPRVTEAASAVYGITFHPNGMDGGLTTVTLTLLLYTTLPRVTRLSLRRGGTRLSAFKSPLSHGKHSHLTVTQKSYLIFHYDDIDIYQIEQKACKLQEM